MRMLPVTGNCHKRTSFGILVVVNYVFSMFYYPSLTLAVNDQGALRFTEPRYMRVIPWIRYVFAGSFLSDRFTFAGRVGTEAPGWAVLSTVLKQ